MSIERIDQPLQGERVVALSPEDASRAATDWRRRPNLFAGRTLTDATLQGRQAWQAGHLQRGGRLVERDRVGVADGHQLGAVEADQRFQFERHGYFVTDRRDHAPQRPVFNRITGLRDSRAK